MCASVVVVGLCEGTYITLDVKTGEIEYNYNGNQPNSNVKGFRPIITNIAGPLKMGKEVDDSHALFAGATLDGTLQLAELKHHPFWELKVGTEQLCTLNTMDMTGDGCEQIVGCWWDGVTLIADRARNLAVFKFEERVSAFLCGHYAVHRGHSVPCFVYVTLFGEIIMYHNVRLESIAVRTLTNIAMDATKTEGTGGVRGGGGMDDKKDLPGLYNSILYDMNRTDAREYVQELRAKLERVQTENKELMEKLQNKSVS